MTKSSGNLYVLYICIDMKIYLFIYDAPPKQTRGRVLDSFHTLLRGERGERVLGTAFLTSQSKERVAALLPGR